MADFDWLARFYATLEYGVFGRNLQNAREQLLIEISVILRDTPKALIAGEGDGRLALAVLEALPGASLFLTESSSGMRRRARQRLSKFEADQVRWIDHVGDAGKCDLLICSFYLDCFCPSEQKAHIEELLSSVKPEVLLIVDFVPPAKLTGAMFRNWCRLLERTMIFFFRTTCGIGATQIVDLDPLMNLGEWKIHQVGKRYGGFVKSTLWKKAKPST